MPIATLTAPDGAQLDVPFPGAQPDPGLLSAALDHYMSTTGQSTTGQAPPAQAPATGSPNPDPVATPPPGAQREPTTPSLAGFGASAPQRSASAPQRKVRVISYTAGVYAQDDPEGLHNLLPPAQVEQNRLAAIAQQETGGTALSQAAPTAPAVVVGTNPNVPQMSQTPGLTGAQTAPTMPNATAVQPPAPLGFIMTPPPTADEKQQALNTERGKRTDAINVLIQDFVDKQHRGLDTSEDKNVIVQQMRDYAAWEEQNGFTDHDHKAYVNINRARGYDVDPAKGHPNGNDLDPVTPLQFMKNVGRGLAGIVTGPLDLFGKVGDALGDGLTSLVAQHEGQTGLADTLNQQADQSDDQLRQGLTSMVTTPWNTATNVGESLGDAITSQVARAQGQTDLADALDQQANAKDDQLRDQFLHDPVSFVGTFVPFLGEARTAALADLERGIAAATARGDLATAATLGRRKFVIEASSPDIQAQRAAQILGSKAKTAGITLRQALGRPAVQAPAPSQITETGLQPGGPVPSDTSRTPHPKAPGENGAGRNIQGQFMPTDQSMFPANDTNPSPGTITTEETTDGRGQEDGSKTQPSTSHSKGAGGGRAAKRDELGAQGIGGQRPGIVGDVEEFAAFGNLSLSNSSEGEVTASGTPAGPPQISQKGLQAIFLPKDADGAPPAILVNDKVYKLLYHVLTKQVPNTGHTGFALLASHFEYAKTQLARYRNTLSAHDLAERENVLKTLEEGLRYNKGRGIGIIRVSPDISEQTSFYTRLHEHVHVMQEKWRLTADQLRKIQDEINTRGLQAVFDKAKSALYKKNYNEKQIWQEIPSWIAEGGYSHLDITQSEANDLLKPYVEQLYRTYGGQAVQEMFGHGSESVRELIKPFRPTRFDQPPSPHQNNSHLYDLRAKKLRFSQHHSGIVSATPSSYQIAQTDRISGKENLSRNDTNIGSHPQLQNREGTPSAKQAPLFFQAAKPSLTVQRMNRLPLPDALDMYARSSPLQKQLLGDALQRKLGNASRTNTLRTRERQRAKALGLIRQ